MSGHFKLSFMGEKTVSLTYNAEVTHVKIALESLKDIGQVDVQRFSNTNGVDFMVTFLTELGNQPSILIYDSQLFGSRIKARVVTMQDGVLPLNYGRRNLPPSQTLFDIKNLFIGKKYNVSVRAFNSRGLGPSSFSSQIFLFGKPKPPRNVTLIVVSDTFIKIVWRPPAFNGGSLISKYRIVWGTDQIIEQRLIETTALRSLHCVNLPVNKRHISRHIFGRISAFNGYEWSEPAYNPSLQLLQLRMKYSLFKPRLKVSMRCKWLQPSRTR